MDVIKESGVSGMSFSIVHAANAVSVVNNNASLNAPSSAFLSTTTKEGVDSFILSSPEFLSLGEVKDPGNVALNQSGMVVAYGSQRPFKDDLSYLSVRVN